MLVIFNASFVKLTCRLQSQLSEKDVMVSKVQPELLRQCSVNKLLGADSMSLHNGASKSEVVSLYLGKQLDSLSWLVNFGIHGSYCMLHCNFYFLMLVVVC